MSVLWVCTLSKAQLVDEIDKIKIDLSRTVLQLRQRLVSWVGPSRFTTKPEDEEGYIEDADRTRDVEETFGEHTDFHSSSPHNYARVDVPPTETPAAPSIGSNALAGLIPKS